MTTQEINEAVAKKLGAEKIGKRAPIMPMEKSADIWRFSSGLTGTLPDYCHDIKAAWEIVESFKPRKLTVILLTREKWACKILDINDADIDVCEDADTAPMAICLAYLKLP